MLWLQRSKAPLPLNNHVHHNAPSVSTSINGSLQIPLCVRKVVVYQVVIQTLQSSSHHLSLVFVRSLVEDEGDGRVPGGREHGVLQPPLVRAVLPERQVTGAVCVLRGRAHLAPVYTALAAEPEEIIISSDYLQSSVTNQCMSPK